MDRQETEIQSQVTVTQILEEDSCMESGLQEGKSAKPPDPRRREDLMYIC